MKKLSGFMVSALLLVPSLAFGIDIESHCSNYKRLRTMPASETVRETDRKIFKDEKQADCDGHLWGIRGYAQNYEKARKCCLVTEGCAMNLAMIHANGWGVARNYDLAIHYLCGSNVNAGGAEVEGMLESIESMRKGGGPRQLLYCDHLTSGIGNGYCEQIDLARIERRIQADIKYLKRKTQAPAHPKLDELWQHAERFVKDDAQSQSDLNRGTASQQADYFNSLKKSKLSVNSTVVGFRLPKDLENTATIHPEPSAENQPELAASPVPSPSPARPLFTARRKDELMRKYAAQEKAANAALGAAVRKQKGDPKAIQLLQEAQRTWAVYRDAFVAYALAHWGEKADADLLRLHARATLARARAAQVKKAKLYRLDVLE